MTDNEIIKAWEDKITLIEIEESPIVSIELITNTLDLIKRQKAENEMLKDLITYQKQEIKEKEQKYNQVVDDMFGLVETTRNEIAEAKSEAIKEFAERFKISFVNNESCGATVRKEIDNIVKEMEENNE